MFSWDTASKPIVALSPMADMTDSPFCIIAKRFGAPVVFREMVSAEALVRESEKTFGMAEFDEVERPIILQIFGNDPDTMAEAACCLEKRYRPDGIDINMGCPVRKITSGLGGSALIKEPELAAEIVRTVKAAIKVPLSVKTRLGWEDPRECLDFAPLLEKAGADLISIHGRTKKQGYSGAADWGAVGEAKKRVSVPVLVNGDVRTPDNAAAALKESGADGLLIGRGALGNPWLFAQVEEQLRGGKVATTIDKETRLRTVLDHAELMVEHYGEHGIILMRKHFIWYFKGLQGGKEVRIRLVQASTLDEVKEILKEAAILDLQPV